MPVHELLENTQLHTGSRLKQNQGSLKVAQPGPGGGGVQSGRYLSTPPGLLRYTPPDPLHPNSSAFQLGWYNRQPGLCNVPNEGLHWSDVLLIGAMWARVGRPLTVLIRTCRTICLGRINLTCRKPEHVVFAASNSVLRRKTTQTELLSALRDYFEKFLTRKIEVILNFNWKLFIYKILNVIT